MKLKKVKMTMRELFSVLSDNSSSTNKPIESLKNAYVKTPNGELAKINYVIHKTDQNMVNVILSDGNSVVCSDKHPFIDEYGNQVCAKNARTVQTINGVVEVLDIVGVEGEDAYDISIPSPHLYITPNGVIHHNTAFGLLMIAAFLRKYDEGVVLFYDTEFGATPSYFESYGIDTTRVLHVPIRNIEEMKFDIIKQLEAIEREDKVLVFVDSIGNIASKKEVDDALSGNSAADMTRAKQLKSLFRMVTPYLTMNDIPMVIINHTYKTQEMFSKDVVSGGTGGVYSSDWIWIVGRQQEKDGKDIAGYNFIINIEKSRFIREKSKIPINVTYENGIQKWSGLLDFAVDVGLILKTKKGWYARTDENGEVEEKNYRAKDTMTADFWRPYFENGRLQKELTKRYALGAVQMENYNEDKFEENEENGSK